MHRQMVKTAYKMLIITRIATGVWGGKRLRNAYVAVRCVCAAPSGQASLISKGVKLTSCHQTGPAYLTIDRLGIRRACR